MQTWWENKAEKPHIFAQTCENSVQTLASMKSSFAIQKQPDSSAPTDTPLAASAHYIFILTSINIDFHKCINWFFFLLFYK